ncbi:hypothetical protein ASF53_16830 [Methylobacterium sp. Leaf123]|uniref:AAA family ATPase n=1 Tax=Methylobacterium sp. Leaf123 TaxID=1736264 RepID=UPI0006F34465|nr:ATP-binding protein [Methylobacterium sp. Leaf123]KQQ11826.1 hypothetical protein ASF53_16830 [Methylobacterium sp. Leaf123]
MAVDAPHDVADIDGPADHPADHADDAYVRAALAGLRSARDVLPVAALLEALGPAGLRRLREPGGLAVVVQIPSPDWAPHIDLAIREFSAFAYAFVRIGSQRNLDRPSEGNDKAASLLAEGARVLGISQAPERYLPASLVAGADLLVRIGPPSNRIINAVIRAATGKRPRRMPPAAAAGLDFDAITASIRLASTPRACLDRLQVAQRAVCGDDVRLADVPPLEELCGYGDAMSWAQNLVRDLDAWREGRLAWEALSRTCVLASAPGLGKSTLVRAIARAARLPLVATSVGDWFTGSSGHIDTVLRFAEQTMMRAAAQAPALLFLDEIDALPNRATMDNRGRDWWTPVVNGILTALDSTTSGPTSRLVVIGATNHPEALDAALVRPGRLHPIIRIAPPDVPALAGILRQHLGADLPGIDLTPVARLGAGGTGADVTAWVKAARAAARAAGRRMILADLVLQLAPPDDRTQEEILICARHEAAHAIAAELLDVARVSCVSIALGLTNAGVVRAAAAPKLLMTRADTEAYALVCLAGRAMDALCGAPNSGAGGDPRSDLGRATAAIAAAHASLGLGETLSYRGGIDEISRLLREDPALRRTVERDLQRLFVQASAFVSQHRPLVEAVAKRLVSERSLSGDAIAALIRVHRQGGAHAVRGGSDAR